MPAKIKITNIQFSISEIEIGEEKKSLASFIVDLFDEIKQKHQPSKEDNKEEPAYTPPRAVPPQPEEKRGEQ